MQHKIAVIGLGYVGLPLAVEFSKHYPVVGYDIQTQKIERLLKGVDYTKELAHGDLHSLLSTDQKEQGFFPTSNPEDLKDCRIYIITVPTPITSDNKPDLEPLFKASTLVAAFLKKGDLVIYESTVYPGCTEEDCVPILEQVSGLTYNKDFFCGYSPERVNPGDLENRLPNIMKVTSGSTHDVALRVDNLYKTIITAGTYLAPSIKVAEASKAIENAQRDVNISFMNELSLMFDKMNIDTHDVLAAAGTKWNFLPFKPGLVGGHCIGVDPYYLAHKAKTLGYHPAVLLSGRKVNDQMGSFVAHKMVKLLLKKGVPVTKSKILILGFTFKENCPDIRNTKVIDVYTELVDYNIDVDVYDPWANKEEVSLTYGINLLPDFNVEEYQGVVLAVSHKEFLSIDFAAFKKLNAVIFDTKAFINRTLVDARL
jgi:UDP-N-acetyl-D-galactosamine dehydrogenase|tara:strand:+ start:93 stop:1370 length:1278 start_codon:yes stop_codon:yes gene_type:complete